MILEFDQWQATFSEIICPTWDIEEVIIFSLPSSKRPEHYQFGSTIQARGPSWNWNIPPQIHHELALEGAFYLAGVQKSTGRSIWSYQDIPDFLWQQIVEEFNCCTDIFYQGTMTTAGTIRTALFGHQNQRPAKVPNILMGISIKIPTIAARTSVLLSDLNRHFAPRQLLRGTIQRIQYIHHAWSTTIRFFRD